MSGSTSQSWRTSGPSSGDSIDLAFEGGEDLLRVWREGLTPDPEFTVSAWADRHRVLSPRGANEAGPWRTSRTPYLREIMDALSPAHPCQRVSFMKGSQVGAPLALDMPIPTPDGWTTMGEIKPGDAVFDEGGKPVDVTGVSPVFIQRDCYEVVFSDGSTIVTDASHLSTVDDEKKYAYRRRVTLTTAAIRDTFKVGKRRERNRYAIPVAGALDLPERNDLLIHPYALGYWLGNGPKAQNQLTAHEDDVEEVASYLSAVGHDTEARRPWWVKGRAANLVVRDQSWPEHLCIRGHDMRMAGVYSFVKRGKPVERCAECARQRAMHGKYGKPLDPVIRPHSFGVRLRRLGLINDKHIPSAYLRASRDQRLALLQGLMDSDGSVTRDGRCELSFSDERLSGDAYELLVSLGLKPSVYERHAGATLFPGGRWSQVKVAHRLSFTAYRDRTPVFRLQRKLGRLPMTQGRRVSETTRRRIIDVRPVKSVPVRCISVASESRLFLAGRAMIPTHNTEAGSNWIGYAIHHAPGPMLAVQPSVELAKRFSQQRIDPLIEESPVLREKVAPARSRDSGNTVLSKEFPGGILVMTGANSAVGLRSMPVRYLFLDEVDAYPPSADDEGDPVALAEARTRTFSWRRKVFLASTPTIKGLSRIEREYAASDQRRYIVPCPHCGEKQWLKFERLRWDKGQPETAAYVCEGCELPIAEHHKTQMLSMGEWRPTATPADPLSIGFHLSSLYSPIGWLSWERIAREWDACQASDESKRSFINTVLGETWAETGEAPDWQRLCERREDFRRGTVPQRGLFLTAGADVQKDRIELSVWAWGRGLESWLVDHVVIDGRPERAAAWAQLSALLGETWPHASGQQLTIGKLAIDTGYESPAVYAWARRMGAAQVLAIKGVDGFSRAAPVVGPTYVDATEGGRRIRRGARLWTIAVATFKSETYRFLRSAAPADAGAYPAGYIHLPRGIDAEWIKQLASEQLVTVKTRRGFTRLEWQKLRERNEALDCRVYARAAAWIAGLDRWSERKWQDLEKQLGIETAPVIAPAAGPAAPNPQAPAGPAHQHDIARPSGWLGGRSRGWLRRR